MLELDATRGAAMLAVVLSHSAWFLLPGNSALSSDLVTLGMVATPTFLLVSGIVCSHLASLEHKSDGRLRWLLGDRGLFLLLIAHLVIGLTHAMWEPAATALGRSFYITDAVGVGLIVAALLVRRASRNQLFVCGSALVVAGWLTSSIVPPGNGFGRTLMRILFGIVETEELDEGWIVPIVPYLGVFLIGMAVGVEYSVRRKSGMSHRTMAHLCFVAGITCMTLAIGFKLGWLILKPHLPTDLHPWLYRLTEPRYKIPPGPAYLLGFGGAGMVMAGCIAWLAQARSGLRIVGAVAVIGRASLFVFVLQYWLIGVPALAFHLHGGALVWLAALCGAIGCIWLLALAWDRANGNRLLTLGLRRISALPPRPLAANGNS